MARFRTALRGLVAALAGVLTVGAVQTAPATVSAPATGSVAPQQPAHSTRATVAVPSVSRTATAPRVVRLVDRRTPGRNRQAWVIRKPRRGGAYAAVLL